MISLTNKLLASMYENDSTISLTNKLLASTYEYDSAISLTNKLLASTYENDSTVSLTNKLLASMYEIDPTVSLTNRLLASMYEIDSAVSLTNKLLASMYEIDSTVSLTNKVYGKKELLKIKIRPRTIIIILVVIALAIIVPRIIMNHYAEKEAEKKDKIIQLSLEQAKYEFILELDQETHERLNNIGDLNTLLEPTKATFDILKRWEVVHQIDPDYPYPETEIEEQDWMGMNRFLHDDGMKAKMIYEDNNNINIDSDVYEYIMHGSRDTDDPIVKEAVEQMEKEQ